MLVILDSSNFEKFLLPHFPFSSSLDLNTSDTRGLDSIIFSTVAVLSHLGLGIQLKHTNCLL
uniref:Uncharacterized protein n=1 Tax=Daphnia magna TaxID=35525 RepID=A0A0P6A8Z2_9CRUS